MLQVSVAKILGGKSGNTKLLNQFLDKTCKKGLKKSKTEKVNINIKFFIFKLA